MFAVFPLSANQVIITGSGGTIITTKDKGQNWQIQRLPEVDWVRHISFISEDEGWIIGNWLDIVNQQSESNIFKTSDGGISWQKLDINLEIDFSVYRLHGIEFLNSQMGFLLANPKSTIPDEQAPYPGLFFITEDGGMKWTQMDIGISRKYHQIVFIDSLTGFLLSQPYYSNHDFEESQLHRTTDGGKTWSTFPDSGFGRINFVNNSVGWAGNFRTTNDGESWEYRKFNFPPLESTIDRIWFTDSITGYAISDRTILKTVDAGDFWSIQTKVPCGFLQDIKFYNSQIGYACGYGGTIFYTSDGGENWYRYGEGITNNLQDVDFIDKNDGWTVGYYGTILHTNNGGNDWEKQILPEECDSIYIRGVDFIDNETGWVAGAGYILKTENGGKDWFVQLKIELSEPTGCIRDIKFLNENIGFAVGQESIDGPGFHYQTSDGGINWQRADHGDLPFPLDEIYFVDNDYGWICGKYTLLSTQDGGQNWTREYCDVFLRCIQFTDHEHGWMSAIDEGAFYRTEDGGKTWTDVPYKNRYYHFMNSFHFFNNNQGIAASWLFCDILSTKDGGLSWSQEERLPPARLNAMTFVNNSLGWAVGTNGTILKFQGSYFDTNNSIYTSYNLTESGVSIYPNPFNPITTITFSLPKASQVKTEVYDLTGRFVTVLCDRHYPAGTYSVQFDGSVFASGIYILRSRMVSTENPGKSQVFTRKMMLMK